MEQGADRIREQTDGRVSLKFRTGGIEGSDEQVLSKIRIGNLQGGAFSAGGLARVYPGLNTYSIPLMFRSLDEVDYVRERLDPKIAAGLEQAGFVSLGFSEGGFSNLLSKEPVSHIDDLRRKKIWVPDNDPVSYRVLEALQLSPQPMAVADARMGISSGLVDVIAASPSVALLLQWHTEVEYRTDLPISYSLGVFAMPVNVFSQISAADQQVVRNVIGDVMRQIDESSRQDNTQAAALMEARGVSVVAVDQSDVADWRASIEALYPELARMRELDAELFNELLALLEAYRADN
jgi:TRAP-type C4-dicarboxylate transport system substrate-binding protein